MEETLQNIQSLPTQLPHPLGTVLKVQGKIISGETTGNRADEDTIFLVINMINDKRLEPAVMIEVQTLSWTDVLLPEHGENVVYMGYETGEIHGIPEEAFEYIPRVATSGFYFKHSFVVIKVIS